MRIQSFTQSLCIVLVKESSSLRLLIKTKFQLLLASTEPKAKLIVCCMTSLDMASYLCLPLLNTTDSMKSEYLNPKGVACSNGPCLYGLLVVFKCHGQFGIVNVLKNLK